MAKDNPLVTYAKYSAIGIEFAVAAVVGVVGGSYFDSYFGTNPWGVFIGAILGLASGFYRLVTVLKEISSQREQQNDRKIERLNLACIGVGTLAGWVLDLVHVPSFLVGGILMQVNFWLLKKIVSLLLFRTGEGQQGRRGATFLVIAKGLIFLLLLSAMFVRYPIQPLSFMAGVSLLVLTCMIVSLLDSWSSSRVVASEK